MRLYPIYQVDVFTNELFKGNPAAVVTAERFFSCKKMQAIAAENNLSETAYVVARADGDYDLRWFTPTHEVDFCGHATIATAHVLISKMSKPTPVNFYTKVGCLQVSPTNKGYEMCAPAFPMHNIKLTERVSTTFSKLPTSAWHSRKNIFLMFPNSDEVANFKPNFSAIKALSSQKGVDDGIIIMASGDGEFAKYDFVSRYFVPAFGINEDPVTGSNHASLAPFWGKRLGKSTMHAYQASTRGGGLIVRLAQDRVYITGQAITYMQGELYLP